MTTKRNSNQYHWLIGSLCIWLLCAGIARQPAQTGEVKSPLTASTDSLKTDPETGLAMDKDLMLVKGQCTACHSSKLILQSHFDREKWVERIRWMQRTQKLWDLGDTEPAVLTYLTKYYGPLKTPFDGRRLPLDQLKWHRESGR